MDTHDYIVQYDILQSPNCETDDLVVTATDPDRAVKWTLQYLADEELVYDPDAVIEITVKQYKEIVRYGKFTLEPFGEDYKFVEKVLETTYA